MAVIEGSFVVGEEQQAAVWQLMSSCGLPQRALPNVTGGDAASGAAFRLTVRREVRVWVKGAE